MVDDKEIKNDIIGCVKDKGKIEKKRVANILSGSDENENSPYFGKYKSLAQSDILAHIEELISSDILKINDLFENLTVNFNKLKPQKTEEKISTDNIEDENIIKAIDFINDKKNVFITGHAGTGKSYILEQLKTFIPDLVITSTTGIAAVNVGGQTIHSWAGIGICNKPIEKTVENILSNYIIRTQIQTCKILAIDEISMLDIKTFEYLNEVLKEVRECDKPFGGIQVIFIGDFFQLPPVDKSGNNPKKYCFESELWQELEFQPIILFKNYRQNEEDLINALSHIRTNSLTREDIRLMKGRECEDSEELADMLHLFSTNEEASTYNQERFDLIPSKVYEFEAEDYLYQRTNVLDYARAEETLYLKLGARVMLLINLDFETGLINGSCGTVAQINPDEILVKFDNGVTEPIQRHEFEFYKNDKLIATRSQFPLMLAYGVTIHKSQGMTLDKLFVDCSRVFENGQTYVALSRVTRLNGLYLKNFNPFRIRTDEKVVEFYKNLYNKG